MLIQLGFGNVVLCDINGAIYEGADWLNPAQAEMAKVTNKDKEQGTLADVMKGADVFVGVSRPNLVTQDMVRSMAEGAIVFPMANPTPEIMPDEALAAGAAVVGTGRSDYPNQINNVLAFPGIFKGALAVMATDITESMKMAAARAIASVVKPEQLKVNIRNEICPKNIKITKKADGYGGKQIPKEDRLVSVRMLHHGHMEPCRQCGIIPGETVP
jgi:malate dehydrogenase (oxaloacetate-decarboxylating)